MPYRGLSPFREADAPFFFGREAFAERLVKAVKARPTMAVIIGPSGSGKSSVVLAGLIPRLREEGDWLFAALRPGGQPFHALAAALLPTLAPELGETDRLIEARKLAVALNGGDIPLYDVVTRILERHPEADRLLLVVDQFEKLYTLCPDAAVRRTFIDLFLQATSQSPSHPVTPPSLHLVLTFAPTSWGRCWHTAPSPMHCRRPH